MMLPLTPRLPAAGGYELLCLGAHSDDLEIGCSGTVLRLLREHPVERVTWVVLSGKADRAQEARRAAEALFGDHPGLRVVNGSFGDGFFPYTAVPVKEFFEQLK